jgi:hypothetical protein
MAKLELGTNYEVEEDSDDLIIRHANNGEILKYDESADQISTVKDFASVSTEEAQFPVQGANDVSNSRNFNTWYQNTSGYPYMIEVTVASSDANDPHWIDSRANLNDSQKNNTISYFRQKSEAGFVQLITHSFIVPDKHYYKLQSFGDGSINNWSEGKIGRAS